MKFDEQSEIVLYTSPDGRVKVDVFLQDETVWLTQKKLAELFEVEVNTVNYHIKEIFDSGELKENSVIRKFRITADDGKSYLTNFYNLDMIISVGYRVNSRQATQFRVWATRVLREYIIKGFALDDERLKSKTQTLTRFLPDMHFGVEAAGEAVRFNGQVVLGLQVHPKLRGHAEKPAEAQGGVG